MMDQKDTNRVPVIQDQLVKALPPIEEDFFRTPLAEEERKEANHTCPRISSMNYLLPPLKDSASAAVKKTDTTLHKIKVSLAEYIRPIEYYAHRRI
ncbi:hypothetical protein AYI69_g3287 [Smittium culicis]|uniref:Uncharacterized protein n=1 Tax=Smittium culicis TaxID=133412 RepID=A0A1R1YKG2_9FUNG|nr:hypothetical protein AYI69_g9993 [Smittium culicis]OMJ27285.1 hypothetical protein AYI69_g3287 [Smittium culicis]